MHILLTPTTNFVLVDAAVASVTVDDDVVVFLYTWMYLLFL